VVLKAFLLDTLDFRGLERSPLQKTSTTRTSWVRSPCLLLLPKGTTISLCTPALRKIIKGKLYCQMRRPDPYPHIRNFGDNPLTKRRIWLILYLVSVHKWLFCPISVSGSDFNPQNTKCIPVVKIFAFLDLQQTVSFMDGHCLVLNKKM